MNTRPQEITRSAYMSGQIDHETYYLALGDLIGREAIGRIVVLIIEGFTLADSGEHLNNIPLRRWDAQDHRVRALIASSGRIPEIMAASWGGVPPAPGRFIWSLCETVCVLKVVALAMMRAREEAA